MMDLMRSGKPQPFVNPQAEQLAPKEDDKFAAAIEPLQDDLQDYFHDEYENDKDFTDQIVGKLEEIRAHVALPRENTNTFGKMQAGEGIDYSTDFDAMHKVMDQEYGLTKKFVDKACHPGSIYTHDIYIVQQMYRTNKFLNDLVALQKEASGKKGVHGDVQYSKPGDNFITAQIGHSEMGRELDKEFLDKINELTGVVPMPGGPAGAPGAAGGMGGMGGRGGMGGMGSHGMPGMPDDSGAEGGEKKGRVKTAASGGGGHHQEYDNYASHMRKTEAERLIDALRHDTRREVNRMLIKASGALLGGKPVVGMAESVGESIHYQQTIRELAYQTERITKDMKRSQTEFMARDDLTQAANIGGKSLGEMQKFYVKNLSVGYKNQKDTLRVTRAGAALSTMIGSEAESTNATFNELYMTLNASAATMEDISRSVQRTAVNSKITGEGLVKAVSAAKPLLDSLRAQGKLSSKTAGTTIGLTAEAQKRGLDARLQPVFSAITGGYQKADVGLQALLANLATSNGDGKLLERLSMNGTLNKKEIKQLSLGSDAFIRGLTGGQANSGNVKQKMQNDDMFSMQMNGIMERMGLGGIDDLLQLTEILDIVGKSMAESMADIDKKLSNTNLTRREKNDIIDQKKGLSQDSRLGISTQMDDMLKFVNPGESVKGMMDRTQGTKPYMEIANDLRELASVGQLKGFKASDIGSPESVMKALSQNYIQTIERTNEQLKQNNSPIDNHLIVKDPTKAVTEAMKDQSGGGMRELLESMGKSQQAASRRDLKEVDPMVAAKDTLNVISNQVANFAGKAVTLLTAMLGELGIIALALGAWAGSLSIGFGGMDAIKGMVGMGPGKRGGGAAGNVANAVAGAAGEAVAPGAIHATRQALNDRLLGMGGSVGRHRTDWLDRTSFKRSDLGRKVRTAKVYAYKASKTVTNEIKALGIDQAFLGIKKGVKEGFAKFGGDAVKLFSQSPLINSKGTRAFMDFVKAGSIRAQLAKGANVVGKIADGGTKGADKLFKFLTDPATNLGQKMRQAGASIVNLGQDAIEFTKDTGKDVWKYVAGTSLGQAAISKVGAAKAALPKAGNAIMQSGRTAVQAVTGKMNVGEAVFRAAEAQEKIPVWGRFAKMFGAGDEIAQASTNLAGRNATKWGSMAKYVASPGSTAKLGAQATTMEVGAVASKAALPLLVFITAMQSMGQAIETSANSARIFGVEEDKVTGTMKMAAESAGFLTGILNSLSFGAFDGWLGANGDLTASLAELFHWVPLLGYAVQSLLIPVKIVYGLLAGLWEGVKEIGKGIMEGLYEVIKPFIEVWDYLQTVVGGLMAELSAVLKPLEDGFKALFGEGAGTASIIGVLTAVLKGLGKAIGWVFKEIGVAIGFLLRMVTPVLKVLINVFAALASTIIKFLAPFAEALGKIFRGVGGYIQGFIKVFDGLFNLNWDQIKDGLGTMLKGVVTVFGGIAEGIMGYLISLPMLVPSAIANMIGAIFTGISDWGKSVGAMFGPIGESIMSIIVYPFTMLGKAFSGIGAGLAWTNKLVSMLSTLDFSAAWNSFKALFDGPLSALKPVLHVIETIASAIGSVVQSIGGWFGRLWGAISSGVSGFFGEIWSGIKDAAGAIFAPFTAIWDSIVSAANDVWIAIKEAFAPFADTFQAIGDMVKSVLSGVWSVIKPIGIALAVLVGGPFYLLGVAIGKIAKFIYNLLPPMSFLTTALKGIGIVIGGIIRVLGFLIGSILKAVIPAITGLIDIIGTVLSTAIKFLAPVIEGVARLFTGVAQTIGGVFDVIKGIFTLDLDTLLGGLEGIGKGVWNIIGGLLEGIGGLILAVFAGIPAVLFNAVGSLFKGIANWGKSIGKIFGPIGEMVMSFIFKPFELLGKLFSGIGSGIASLVKLFVMLTKGDFSGAWEMIKSGFKQAFVDLPKWIGEGLVALPGMIMSALGDLGSWVGKGLSSIPGIIMDTFTNAWDGVTDYFRNSWLGEKLGWKVTKEDKVAEKVTQAAEQQVGTVKSLDQKLAFDATLTEPQRDLVVTQREDAKAKILGRPFDQKIADLQAQLKSPQVMSQLRSDNSVGWGEWVGQHGEESKRERLLTNTSKFNEQYGLSITPGQMEKIIETGTLDAYLKSPMAQNDREMTKMWSDPAAMKAATQPQPIIVQPGSMVVPPAKALTPPAVGTPAVPSVPAPGVPAKVSSLSPDDVQRAVESGNRDSYKGSLQASTDRLMSELAIEGTKKGSIYTHDIYLESIMMEMLRILGGDLAKVANVVDAREKLIGMVNPERVAAESGQTTLSNFVESANASYYDKSKATISSPTNTSDNMEQAVVTALQTMTNNVMSQVMLPTSNQELNNPTTTNAWDTMSQAVTTALQTMTNNVMSQVTPTSNQESNPTTTTNAWDTMSQAVTTALQTMTNNVMSQVMLPMSNQESNPTTTTNAWDTMSQAVTTALQTMTNNNVMSQVMLPTSNQELNNPTTTNAWDTMSQAATTALQTMTNNVMSQVMLPTSNQESNPTTTTNAWDTMSQAVTTALQTMTTNNVMSQVLLPTSNQESNPTTTTNAWDTMSQAVTTALQTMTTNNVMSRVLLPTSNQESNPTTTTNAWDTISQAATTALQTMTNNVMSQVMLPTSNQESNNFSTSQWTSPATMIDMPVAHSEMNASFDTVNLLDIFQQGAGMFADVLDDFVFVMRKEMKTDSGTFDVALGNIDRLGKEIFTTSTNSFSTITSDLNNTVRNVGDSNSQMVDTMTHRTSNLVGSTTSLLDSSSMALTHGSVSEQQAYFTNSQGDIQNLVSGVLNTVRSSTTNLTDTAADQISDILVSLIATGGRGVVKSSQGDVSFEQFYTSLVTSAGDMVSNLTGNMDTTWESVQSNINNWISGVAEEVSNQWANNPATVMSQVMSSEFNNASKELVNTTQMAALMGLRNVENDTTSLISTMTDSVGTKVSKDIATATASVSDKTTDIISRTVQGDSTIQPYVDAIDSVASANMTADRSGIQPLPISDIHDRIQQEFATSEPVNANVSSKELTDMVNYAEKEVSTLEDMRSILKDVLKALQPVPGSNLSGSSQAATGDTRSKIKGPAATQYYNLSFGKFGDTANKGIVNDGVS
jgi:phage-related protein